MLIKNSEEA